MRRDQLHRKPAFVPASNYPNRRLLSVGETELVVTQHKHITFIDAFIVDTQAFVLDSIRGAEVLNIERPIPTNHGGVFPRDVPILNW